MSELFAVWRDYKNGVFHSSRERHAHRTPLELYDTAEAAAQAAELYNRLGRFAPAAKPPKEKEQVQCNLFD